MILRRKLAVPPSRPPQVRWLSRSWIGNSFVSVALGLLLFALGCSAEREFPNQPISLICPWSAGGGTDRVARQVAAQLESELGVPVNVINAIGGSGVTGHTRGAVARADGYTLTMITVELSMLHWRGLTSVTHEDFAPLQLLNRDPAALFVRKDSVFQSLDDLQAAIDSAAASGKKLKASGTAYGGIWHIATAGWLDRRGLAPDAVNWVSINGAGPSIQELLAGGIDFLCCSLPEADAVLDAQVRCLGVMSDERISGFEDVPTFQEQAHDWSIAGWRGIAAPRETPPERLQVLGDALARVTATESFRDFMAAAGFDISLEAPAEFAQTLQRQDRLFGDILTSEALRGVSGEHFGPLMFPTIVAIGLVVVLVVVSIELWREQAVMIGETSPAGAVEAAAGDGAEPAGSAGAQNRFGYPVAVAVAVIFYIVASEPLGFVTTAMVMLAGLLCAFRVRLPVALSVAVLTALVTYQVFGLLLRVPLPRGFLEW